MVFFDTRMPAGKPAFSIDVCGPRAVRHWVQRLGSEYSAGRAKSMPSCTSRCPRPRLRAEGSTSSSRSLATESRSRARGRPGPKMAVLLGDPTALTGQVARTSGRTSPRSRRPAPRSTRPNRTPGRSGRRGGGSARPDVAGPVGTECVARVGSFLRRRGRGETTAGPSLVRATRRWRPSVPERSRDHATGCCSKLEQDAAHVARDRGAESRASSAAVENRGGRAQYERQRTSVQPGRAVRPTRIAASRSGRRERRGARGRKRRRGSRPISRPATAAKVRRSVGLTP